jgi:hypothetical protein
MLPFRRNISNEPCPLRALSLPAKPCGADRGDYRYPLEETCLAKSTLIGAAFWALRALRPLR